MTIGSDAAVAVETRGLTKRFGTVLALDSLDLEVPAGSIFGFLGPNGAGKTTTLRLLTGLSRPTHGTARVAGVDVAPGRTDLQRVIGYLDQDPRFYGWMRGREVLRLVGELQGLHGATLRSRIDEVVEIVDLADAISRATGGYSGGMRQRLGLAAALLARPTVLFLDEPVSALDPAGRHDTLAAIGRLRGQTTVFMSTHILNDVERVCDRVGILDHGRLVTHASMEDLLERFARPIYLLEPEPGQDEAVARFAAGLPTEWVAAATVEHGLVRVHVRDARVASRELVAAVARSGIALVRLERQRPSLEDVFLQLVGAESPAGTAPSVAPARTAGEMAR